MHANPLDKEAERWLKFVEVLHRDIPMDEILNAVQGVLAEEVEGTEKREEMIERIFVEAMKRGNQDGTV